MTENFRNNTIISSQQFETAKDELRRRGVDVTIYGAEVRVKRICDGDDKAEYFDEWVSGVRRGEELAGEAAARGPAEKPVGRGKRRKPMTVRGWIKSKIKQNNRRLWRQKLRGL